MLIVFFDGKCPLCHRAVRFIAAEDKKRIFYFAPLRGTTAKRVLADFNLKNPTLDTMVLSENEKFYIEARAVLRTLWLLDGKWKWIGWLFFLPSPLFDILYRVVARNRYRWFSSKTPFDVQSVQERLLP